MISPHPKILLPIAPILFIGFLISGGADAAQTYRWVDEEGKVHYSDKIPPDQAKLRRETLNKQGITVNVIPGAKTQEEIAKEQRLQKMREAQEKLLAEQRARDETLLHTYRSEKDLLVTMETKVKVVDNRQQLVHATIRRLRESLESQHGRAAEFERNGQQVPQSVLEGISATKREIDSANRQIEDIEHEKAAVKEKFNRELERYRTLTDRSHGAEKKLRAAAEVEGIFICPKGWDCAKAWDLAKRYVEQNTTTGLMVTTDSLIYTKDPEDSRDVALSVSKLRTGRDSIRFFLNARCRKNSLGDELCASRKVTDIRSGFKPFIEAEIEPIKSKTTTTARTDTSQTQTPSAPIAEAEIDGDIPGLFECANERICDKAWKVARRYVEKNATTIVKIDSERLIYSEDPAIPSDVALAVNKVRTDLNTVQLLLDVRCQQNGEILLGAQLCANDKISDIRSGFKPFIEAGLGLSTQH
ncbi:MAG: DUF4124 domain-containing protein [Pseudomonadota bacterium]